MQKTPGPNGFISRLYQELKENNNSNHTQNFPEYGNLEQFPTYFVGLS